MVMGLLPLSAPSPEPSLIPWDGAGDTHLVPNGWVLGRKKIPKDPVSSKARPVFFTVAYKSFPGFKLDMVPGDGRELPHVEHTRGDQR